MQADVYPWLMKNEETVPDDEEDIPTFMYNVLCTKLEHDKKSGHEQKFMDVQYEKFEEMFSTMEEPARADSKFEPISIQKHLNSQLMDDFSADV